jgi:molybdate transport system substrate-binding protein
MLRVLLVAGALSTLGACGADDPSDSTPPSTPTGPAGEITVSAAASLTAVFEAIVEQFEDAHPGAAVALNFQGSSTLAQQVLDGAAVDVFAAADEASMAEVVDADAVRGEPVVFATNSLAIVVKPGNPDEVDGIGDLDRSGVVALCGETVPCGRLADDVLARAGVSLDADRVTRTQNVKGAVSAVAEGDAGAAIVYETDVAAAASTVQGIRIPSDQNASTSYSIAVLEEAAEKGLAQAFVDFVAGPVGRELLDRFGFGPPP